MSEAQDQETNKHEERYLKLQQSQMISANIKGISQLLNTGLNSESLDICIKLLEAGIHPQVLAQVVKQIQQEVAEINAEDSQ